MFFRKYKKIKKKNIYCKKTGAYNVLVLQRSYSSKEVNEYTPITLNKQDLLSFISN